MINGVKGVYECIITPLYSRFYGKGRTNLLRAIKMPKTDIIAARITPVVRNVS